MHLTAQMLAKTGKADRMALQSEKGPVIVMGLILFILLSALEIVLAAKGCGREKEKKVWLKNRLFVRLAEIAVVLIAFLLPFGQKWRLIPLLGFLAVLGIIALLKWLGGRKKENIEKKTGAAVSNCVFSILFICLLLIPAFVFTGYKGLPVSGPRPVGEVSAILVDSSRTDPFEQDGSFREVPVHFYYPADAAENEKFPLVVFSHGAFGYYQSNTSTYMELASNGYVVASLDHPHHAFFTQDTGGRTILADQGFFQTAMGASGDPNDNAEASLAVFREWMDLRTADMNFALDTLETAGIDASLDSAWFLPENNAATILSVLKSTDLTKIGLMGHSMGGATAVQLGRERDDISSVIDLDGTMLSEYTGVENGKLTIRGEAYPLPVLEFNNWDTYNERREYLAQGGLYPNDEVIRSAAEGYAVTIRDTLHMDFTDLPLLSPFLGRMLGSGERGSRETMTIVNGLVRDFFDHTLKGTGAFSVQEIY